MSEQVLESRQAGASEPSVVTVERATGVLMGHFGVDRDAAVHLLRTWSSQRQMSIDAVSRCVVGSVSPGAVVHADDLAALAPRRSVAWLPSPGSAGTAADAGRLARRRLVQLIEVLDDSW